MVRRDRDAWCANCNQVVRPEPNDQVGIGIGMLVFMVAAVVAFGGVLLLTLSFIGIILLVLAILVGSVIVGAKVSQSRHLLRCPICHTTEPNLSSRRPDGQLV